MTGVECTADGVLLDIATPAGRYRLTADWVIAADGARSTLRRLMDLAFEGRVFADQFLICDIKMKMKRPVERWFWFDPPFNRGRSALLHRQADDVWRLDFQVGAEADRDDEVKPENVAGACAPCWARTSTSPSSGSASTASSRGACSASATAACCSPATPRTRCRRSARAAATAACRTPTISCGSSISCCAGWRPKRLLDSYDAERVAAADENLLNTTRSTDFIAPKSAASRTFRDGVLALAETEPFARRLVNSGRLSVATCYDGSPLNGADGFAAGDCPRARPGAAALDAPLGDGWLLHALGEGFTGVWFSPDGDVPAEVAGLQAALCQRESGGSRARLRRDGLHPLRRRARARLLPLPPRRPHRRPLAPAVADGCGSRARARDRARHS